MFSNVGRCTIPYVESGSASKYAVEKSHAVSSSGSGSRLLVESGVDNFKARDTSMFRLRAICPKSRNPVFSIAHSIPDLEHIERNDPGPRQHSVMRTEQRQHIHQGSIPWYSKVNYATAINVSIQFSATFGVGASYLFFWRQFAASIVLTRAFGDWMHRRWVVNG